MPEIFFGKLNNFALLSIPMFIIMGAAIASTRAGCRSLRGAGTLADAGAGRPGGLQPRRLRAVRGDVGLVSGDLRRHRQDGHPRDAQARLSRHGRLGLHRGGRHARHPDPALGDDDRLRHRHRNLDRAAVPGRRHSGPAAGGPVHGLVALLDTWRSGNDAGAGRGNYTWKQKFEILPRVAPFIADHPRRALRDVWRLSPRRRRRRPWARCCAW
jgi:C4-dicarboxylate transporter DctM subunit